jgi:selenocysteine lyase/cysteine desulfurase
MLKRKLESIRTLEAEAARIPPPIAYNPGTMTDPLPAVERAMAAFRRRIRGNPIAAYDKARSILRELRPLAAEVFGGAPGGWAFADGHTATIDRLAGSLVQLLGDGARVVSTDSEHVGGLGAFTADPRFRVTQVSPERLVDTPGKVYFLSHVTYDTNRDLGEVIQALVRRADAPLVVVDGTQALAQVEVDVGALGCHAYLASAHKWLGGPHGTGLLYLREDVIEAWPTPFRAGEPLCTELPIGRWEPRGGQDFSRIAGVAAAIRAYQVHARPGRALRRRFITRLEAALGERVRVLESSAENGRVVAFELEGTDVYPVYRALTRRGVAVKCIRKGPRGGTPGLDVLRVGFPWWTDAAHIDVAVSLLTEVVAELEAVPTP